MLLSLIIDPLFAIDPSTTIPLPATNPWGAGPSAADDGVGVCIAAWNTLSGTDTALSGFRGRLTSIRLILILPKFSDDLDETEKAKAKSGNGKRVLSAEKPTVY
jgi:hypothetical protein